MGYKLGYHILVLLNQVLFINSVLTNQVLLYLILKKIHFREFVLRVVHCMYTLFVVPPLGCKIRLWW